MWQAPMPPGPAFGAGPQGQVAPPNPEMRPEQMGEQLGRKVEVHIEKLLDMPRKYVFRRPRSYIVKAFSEDDLKHPLARSRALEGYQGWTPQGHDASGDDIDNLDVKPSEGRLRLETESNLIYIQIEYTGDDGRRSSGEIIGRCHIHRLDPRSAQTWPYMLSDLDGNSVNCGIQLRLAEIDGQIPRQRPMPQEQMHPEMAQHGMPQQGMPYPGQMGYMDPQMLSHYYGMVEPAHHRHGAPPGYPHTPHPGQVFGAPNLHGMVPGVPQGAPNSAVMYTYSYSLPPVEHANPVVAGDYNRRAAERPKCYYDRYAQGPTFDVFETDRVDDGLTEAWAIKPQWSISGLDGDERDLEFKAKYHEEWNKPLDAYDKPLFLEEEHRMFADMDVSLVKAVAPRHKFKQAAAKEASSRAKEGLPELSFDQWIPYTKPLEAIANPEAPKRKIREAVEDVLVEKWAQGLSTLPRLARGKVHVEMGQVDPKQAEKIQLESLKLTDLHQGMEPDDFEVQVIGQLEPQGQPRHEKKVWYRTPKQKQEKQWSDQESWMRAFGTNELSVYVTCQRGHRGGSHVLNQDNFSLTKANHDMVLYVICDGHGPWGHLVSYRVVQSLPKILFDLLQSPNHPAPEEALLHSFHEANEDLSIFASTQRFDVQDSGTTCAAVLRIGPDVQVAWVGDCGAVGATVDQEGHMVDFVTTSHTTEVPKEYERLKAHGAMLQKVHPHKALRVFKPHTESPGLFATRCLGDTLANDRYGISSQPDVKKTSFPEKPGVILLASGGLWSVIPDGDGVLSILTKSGVYAGCNGHRHALMALSGLAQKIWSKEEEGGTGHFCDDITCMLLHWERPGMWEPPPRPRSLHSGSPPRRSAHQGQEEARGDTPPRSRSKSKSPPQNSRVIDRNEIAQSPSRAKSNSPPTKSRDTKNGEDSIQRSVSKPLVSTGKRTKPTTTQPSLSRNEMQDLRMKTHLVQPDPALSHPDILAQVVSCIDLEDSHDSEKSVWLSKRGEPTASRIDNTDRDWLSEFQAKNIQVGTISKKGRTHSQSHDPNQDSYSMTSATGNRAVYVVCDGHGTLGHIVSFRVAQTLPMFVLKGLSAIKAKEPPENVLNRAIKDASAELDTFAKESGLDLADSGTSCCAAVRLEDRVFVAWVGDCRALVATVAGQHKRVDLMSTPHLASDGAEYRRICEAGGLSVQPGKSNDMARVTAPGETNLGLSISRALGDFRLTRGKHAGGIICQPDMTKTTFGGGGSNPPGLVLLTSGGVCECFDGNVGDEILDELAVKGPLLQKGPDAALKSLCHISKEKWKARFNEYCEDMSAILIRWVGPSSATTLSSTALLGQPHSSILHARPQNIPLQEQSQPMSSLATISERAPPRPTTLSASSHGLQTSQVKSWLGGSSLTMASGQLQQSAISGFASRGPSLGAAPIQTSIYADGQEFSELVSHGASFGAVPIQTSMSRGASPAAIPSQTSGQELSQGRVLQSTHSLPSRAIASSTLAPESYRYQETASSTLAPESYQGEPRKFLQAQPRSSGAPVGGKARVALQAPPVTTVAGQEAGAG
jgi:serine/threonine protein phosphatase PrpC